MVINSKEENNYISGKIGDPHWIGFSDISVEGEWRSVHGDKLTKSSYRNWEIGEPNNIGGNVTIYLEEKKLITVRKRKSRSFLSL